MFVRVNGSHPLEAKVATRVEGFHLREVRVLRAIRSLFPPTGGEGSYKD